MDKQRIGVFSGTFDPVHRGHIESCVVALGTLMLTTVCLFLEKKPRRKTGVADFRDRANMLDLATIDYPSLRIVDLEEDNVTTDNALNYLEKQFPGREYWYIIGSDILEHLPSWPKSDKLLKKFNLCVVLRENNEFDKVTAAVKKLQEKYPDTQFVVLPSVWSPISSSSAKKQLKKGELVTGLDPAVQEYIKRHNIY